MPRSQPSDEFSHDMLARQPATCRTWQSSKKARLYKAGFVWEMLAKT